ncbi:MAG TPA: AIR synthase-related protein, partial [Sphingomonas sp.]|nr:AIR synthase-related protein [Sphingomonas sp.]
GDIILVVGTRGGHLGQSLWLRDVHGREEGPPPPVDLTAERAAGDLIRAGIAAGQLTAVHDVADGGVAVTIAEMALAGNIGAMIDRKQPFDCARSFFAEDQGLYIVTIDDHAMLDFLTAAHNAGVDVEPMGRTGGKRLIFERPDRDDVVTLDALRTVHEGFFPKLMDATLA